MMRRAYFLLIKLIADYIKSSRYSTDLTGCSGQNSMVSVDVILDYIHLFDLDAAFSFMLAGEAILGHQSSNPYDLQVVFLGYPVLSGF